MSATMIAKAHGQFPKAKAHEWATLFILTAASILLLTAVAKVEAAFEGTRILNETDPIFGISFRYLMLLVALLEIVVACICFFSNRIGLKLAVLAWIGISFMIYRAGLSLVSWRKPCFCLGKLTESLHLSPQAADVITTTVLIYILGGTFGFTYWFWSCNRKHACKLPMIKRTTLGPASKSFALGALILQAAFSSLSFEIGGQYSYTGTLSNRFTGLFHVSIDGCRWSISTWPSANTQRAYASAMCDGTNVYRITHFGGEPRTNIARLDEHAKLKYYSLPPGKVAVPRNQGAVTVTPGPIPDFDASFIAPLWLMFASGCVLDSYGEAGELKPFWLTGPAQSPDIAQADWERSSEAPHFATRVVFRRKSDAAFKAVFEANDFQRESGFSYPQFGRFSQFVTNPKATNVTDLKTLTVTELRVERISLGKAFKLASVPSNSVVIDQRLKITAGNERPVFFSYFTSNGVLADVEQLRGSPQYIVELEVWRAKRRNQQFARFLLLVGFAAALSIPLAYLFFARSGRRKETTKTP